MAQHNTNWKRKEQLRDHIMAGLRAWAVFDIIKVRCFSSNFLSFAILQLHRYTQTHGAFFFFIYYSINISTLCVLFCFVCCWANMKKEEQNWKIRRCALVVNLSQSSKEMERETLQQQRRLLSLDLNDTLCGSANKPFLWITKRKKKIKQTKWRGKLIFATQIMSPDGIILCVFHFLKGVTWKVGFFVASPNTIRWSLCCIKLLFYVD